VFEPAGNLYQRSEVDSTGRGRVFAELPVAGTWIQQFAMTGRWRVKVFLDDQPRAAGATNFELR
jgi:hypothetical protein